VTGDLITQRLLILYCLQLGSRATRTGRLFRSATTMRTFKLIEILASWDWDIVCWNKGPRAVLMSVQVTCYKTHSETWPRLWIQVEPIQRTNQCISGGRYWGTWWSWIEISTFRWPLSICVDLHLKLKLTSNNYKLILQNFDLLFVSYCRVHALIFKLRWNAGFHLTTRLRVNRPKSGLFDGGGKGH
jgi:hypothetical protein